MLSESSRMSSADEARFRVQASPSTSRALNVIALDPACDGLVARLRTHPWNGVAFFPASALRDAVQTETAATAGGHVGSPLEDMAAADFVVMIARSGGNAQGASVIGEICSLQRVTTTTLVVHAAPSTDEALSKTLAQVRPWSLMVVVVSDESYVESILRSFR
jgi:hypothetical protein